MKNTVKSSAVAKPKSRTGRILNKAERIRRLLSKGKTVQQVMDYLNKHGVPVHYSQVYRYTQ